MVKSSRHIFIVKLIRYNSVFQSYNATGRDLVYCKIFELNNVLIDTRFNYSFNLYKQCKQIQIDE